MVDGMEWAGNEMKSVLAPVNLASSLFFESPEGIFLRVYREIHPRTPVPPIGVKYKAFANANSQVRMENGAITQYALLTCWRTAPAPVTEALAHILLGKLFRKPAAGGSMNTVIAFI